MGDLTARIPCTHETRRRIASLKRDDERYEDVLQRLHSEHAGDTENA